MTNVTNLAERRQVRDFHAHNARVVAVHRQDTRRVSRQARQLMRVQHETERMLGVLVVAVVCFLFGLACGRLLGA